MRRDGPAEPWLSFLDDLDASLAGPVDLHCIGGFVVSQHYGFARETADLDVLSVIPQKWRFLAQAGLITREILLQRFETELEPYLTGRTPHLEPLDIANVDFVLLAGTLIETAHSPAGFRAHPIAIPLRS